MLVRKLVLSNKTNSIKESKDILSILEHATRDTKFTRLAFAGSTNLGRAGVAINLDDGTVTGHKMQAMPPHFLNLVTHVARTEVRRGLELLAQGEDILIGDRRHGILVRWTGPTFEIFAAGEDSK